MLEQNIVYFIGAGFSAPFGLPVMNNFIDKARDLYFSKDDKFKKLEPILNMISIYSNIKNAMNINLFNIEDLLSLLAMETYTKQKEDNNLLHELEEFIKTVIEAYTPDVEKSEITKFAIQISNAKIDKITSYEAIRGDKKYYEHSYKGKKYNNTYYGIISLNYDMLIEKGLNNLQNYYNDNNIYSIGKEWQPTCFKTFKEIIPEGIPLAKLHGSVDSEIVPPTWNKTANKNILKDWILARRLLEDATHLIFLGYSLPITDNYIKYLLAGSLNHNHRLKRISVITKDTDGSTKLRYKELFGSFRNYRFHDCDMEVFFKTLYIDIKKDSFFNFDFIDEIITGYNV